MMKSSTVDVVPVGAPRDLMSELLS